MNRFIQKNYVPLKLSHPEMKLIIVDDGSVVQPAIDVIQEIGDPDIQLYKVVDDLGFNSHGARNLAMKVTDKDWNLMIDLDVIVQPRLINTIRNIAKDVDTAYYCSIIDRIRGKKYHSLRFINHLLIHRELFWRIGGYDEEFVGYYHGDGEFIESLGRVGNLILSLDLEIDIIEFMNRKPSEHDKSELEPIEDMVYKRIVEKRFSEKPSINFKWVREL
jgi:GT2 family glycosyltransferase